MNSLKRFLVLFVFLLLSFVLQLLILPQIQILFVTPNLLLALTIASGLIYGKTVGLTMGICCGLLMDMLGSGTPGYYLLIFSWIGYLDGILSKTIETEMLPMLCLFFVANEIVYQLYCYAFGFVLGKSYNFGQFLIKSFLPETVITLVMFFIINGVLGYITKRWDLRIRQSEVRIV